MQNLIERPYQAKKDAYILLSGDEQYRHDMYEHSLKLSDEERGVLIGRARAGDEQARTDLIRSFLRYCSMIAARYAETYSWASPNLGFQDLAQLGVELVIQMMDAAITRDKPFAFSYIAQAVHMQVMLHCGEHATSISIPRTYSGKLLPAFSVVSLDAPLGSDEDCSTLADMLVAPDLGSSPTQDYTALHQMIDVLPARQQEMVLRHYGMRDHAPISLTAISQQDGKAPATVYAHYRAALSNLRLLMEHETIEPEAMARLLREQGKRIDRRTGAIDRVRQMLLDNPNMANADVARTVQCDPAIVTRVRKQDGQAYGIKETRPQSATARARPHSATARARELFAANPSLGIFELARVAQCDTDVAERAQKQYQQAHQMEGVR